MNNSDHNDDNQFSSKRKSTKFQMKMGERNADIFRQGNVISAHFASN